MTETLINRKTAELARSKGFLLTCDSFYCENYEGLCMERDEFLWVESLENPIYDCNAEFDEGLRYYAPTQALLQKWLRENHQIYVSVRESWSFDNILEFVCTINGSFVSHDKLDLPLNRFDSYESALEAGLLEALLTINN